VTVEDSDSDKEPGYASRNLSREGEVIIEPDSGDKMEIMRMKRMKKVNLVGLKEFQFHTTLNFIIRATYKRMDHTHLCLLQAHPHY
jgi:hypothetical protein